MPITANTLFRDSLNFMRNQLSSIVLLSLLAAFITVILNQALTPNREQLDILSSTTESLANSSSMSLQEMVKQMTPEQQLMLLKVSAAATFSTLIGSTILVGGLLTLIQLVSQGMRTSALRSIGAAAPVLPRLLLLLLICTFLVQLGLMLYIIPGIALAIAFSLAPIVATTEKLGVFRSMKTSVKLVYAQSKNILLVAPATVLWLAAKMLLLLMASHLTMLTPMVASIVMGTVSNIISALLLIYLFRLYMKWRVQITHKN